MRSAKHFPFVLLSWQTDHLFWISLLSKLEKDSQNAAQLFRHITKEEIHKHIHAHTSKRAHTFAFANKRANTLNRCDSSPPLRTHPLVLPYLAPMMSFFARSMPAMTLTRRIRDSFCKTWHTEKTIMNKSIACMSLEDRKKLPRSLNLSWVQDVRAS